MVKINNSILICFGCYIELASYAKQITFPITYTTIPAVCASFGARDGSTIANSSSPMTCSVTMSGFIFGRGFWSGGNDPICNKSWMAIGI